jgi:hypothetical protein
VPYPEEIDDGLVIRKDYRMNGFPRDQEGKPWYEISDEDYFHWLADYLPDNLPQLTREQEEVRLAWSSDKVISPLLLGSRAGWYDSNCLLRPYCDFPVDFFASANFSQVGLMDGGYSYEDYKEWVEDVDLPEIPLMSEKEYILVDYCWHLILREEQKQFQELWPGFSKRDGLSGILKIDSLHNEPPDAGWRIYLGLVLQKLGNKEERIKALREFYQEWQYILSK